MIFLAAAVVASLLLLSKVGMNLKSLVKDDHWMRRIRALMQRLATSHGLSRSDSIFDSVYNAEMSQMGVSAPGGPHPDSSPLSNRGSIGYESKYLSKYGAGKRGGNGAGGAVVGTSATSAAWSDDPQARSWPTPHAVVSFAANHNWLVLVTCSIVYCKFGLHQQTGVDVSFNALHCRLIPVGIGHSVCDVSDLTISA